MGDAEFCCDEGDFAYGTMNNCDWHTCVLSPITNEAHHCSNFDTEETCTDKAKVMVHGMWAECEWCADNDMLVGALMMELAELEGQTCATTYALATMMELGITCDADLVTAITALGQDATGLTPGMTFADYCPVTCGNCESGCTRSAEEYCCDTDDANYGTTDECDWHTCELIPIVNELHHCNQESTEETCENRAKVRDNGMWSSCIWGQDEDGNLGCTKEDATFCCDADDDNYQ